jgi:putative addiction module component (TIGR02574 family)
MVQPEQSITEAALALSPEQRERLAERLFASLQGDPEIEAAWEIEIARRIEEFRSGAARTYAADEVIEEARRRLRHRDPPSASRDVPPVER